MKFKALLAAAALYCTVGCSQLGFLKSPFTGMVGKIDKTAVIEHLHSGSSDYAVVLLPDLHGSSQCHQNIYLTLEGMNDQTLFVGREGRFGETDHAKFAGNYYHQLLPNGDLKLNGKFDEFVKLPLEERVKKIHQLIKNDDYPVYIEKGRGLWPIGAVVLNEAVYQDKVKTIGIEDPEQSRKTAIMYYYWSRGRISTYDFYREVVVERNNVFFKNIKRNVKKLGTDKGKLVPFVVGRFHVPGIQKLLEDEDISYLIIEHKGCQPPKKKKE